MDLRKYLDSLADKTMDPMLQGNVHYVFTLNYRDICTNSNKSVSVVLACQIV